MLKENILKINYQTILKKPLIISDANNDFKYSDATIIEPFTDNLADLNRFYELNKKTSLNGEIKEYTFTN